MNLTVLPQVQSTCAACAWELGTLKQSDNQNLQNDLQLEAQLEGNLSPTISSEFSQEPSILVEWQNDIH